MGRIWPAVVTGVAALAVLAGCGASSTSSPGPTVTVTSTVTTTASPNQPAATGEATPAFFKDGYPKVVPASQMPSQMIDMADGNAQVILIAPGVYGQKVPGVTPVEAATTGTTWGYCSAVKKWENTLKTNGYQLSGNSCW